MSERKTMRPVTLRRVIEVCNLVKRSRINIHDISEILKISKSHATEIVREIERMKLIVLSDKDCISNQNTINFLTYFADENWREIHRYFFSYYQFYRDYVNLLSNNIHKDFGLSVDLIQEEAESQSLNLNRTSVEVLSDWCDRLKVLQRHLYNGRIYLLKDKPPSSATFAERLQQCFRILVSSKRLGQVFVEIPRIREDVCERLNISREMFDTMLKQFYLENVGKVELSGAPITTMAKESPLGEKKMHLCGKEQILSPRFVLERKREGLVFRNKSYFYIAIHRNRGEVYRSIKP